jgi:hypothetical protein
MMRLTIIPIDKAVYVDNVMYSDLSMATVPLNVHALQWFGVSGWIEFNDGSVNQEITELPSWANTCIAEWEAADYSHKNPPPPPPPTAEENKLTAMSLLAETDWTALPDVVDPLKSNPYLANANDFNTYRNALRRIATAPLAGELVWPIPPNEVWSPGTV